MDEEANATFNSRVSTPQIPPGVVPSPSEEILYDMMWKKTEEASENDVVRDVAPSDRGDPGSRRVSATEIDPFELTRSESRMSPTIRGTPPKAWSSLSRHGRDQSPLVTTIRVRSSNEELSGNEEREEVATPPLALPKGRATRRITPMGPEALKRHKKGDEKRVKDTIGIQEKNEPELLKFREISSPERHQAAMVAKQPLSEDSGLVDSNPVTSTPKPEDEDHVYDDVFTEDELTFVEKDWEIPGLLDLSQETRISGLTPLHYAASLGKRRYLLELINAIRMKREPVFHLLTPDGKKHMLGDNSRISHSTMTDMNCLDGCGRTALMHAVHWNRLDCARLMIYEGADINIAMPDGTTCLHQAAYSSSVEIVNLLLHHRADPEARDSEGRTPFHWATNNPSSKVLCTLLDKVSDLDINVADSAGMTPLMWAAYNGNAEHVQILLEREADTNLVDIDGMAVVHWAVQQDSVASLKLLLTHHNSKIKDSKGKTVLHCAAEQGACNCINYIISFQSNVIENVDNENRTSLHWAAACNKPDVIQALLSKGANVNARDNQERTPYDYAMLKEFVYCALLLSKQSTAKDTTTRSNPKLEQLLKGLASGCWMDKFTKKGRGPLCKRLFLDQLFKRKNLLVIFC